jgi:hypothetical protein
MSRETNHETLEKARAAAREHDWGALAREIAARRPAEAADEAKVVQKGRNAATARRVGARVASLAVAGAASAAIGLGGSVFFGNGHRVEIIAAQILVAGVVMGAASAGIKALVDGEGFGRVGLAVRGALWAAKNGAMAVGAALGATVMACVALATGFAGDKANSETLENWGLAAGESVQRMMDRYNKAVAALRESEWRTAELSGERAASLCAGERALAHDPVGAAVMFLRRPFDPQTELMGFAQDGKASSTKEDDARWLGPKRSAFMTLDEVLAAALGESAPSLAQKGLDAAAKKWAEKIEPMPEEQRAFVAETRQRARSLADLVEMERLMAGARSADAVGAEAAAAPMAAAAGGADEALATQPRAASASRARRL